MADRKGFPLRLDPRLYDVLRRWADDELRSVNAQIEYLLARAAREAGRWPDRGPAPAGAGTRRPPIDSPGGVP